MTGKKKNNKTGLAGFLRYRKKGMSGEERNAFERELHKDPFAEEAEEGLSSYDPEMIRKDMDSLRKRLSSRTGSRQRAIILRIAASVAILMVLTSVLIILERSRSSINQVSGEKTQIAFNIESRFCHFIMATRAPNTMITKTRIENKVAKPTHNQYLV